MKAFYKKHTLRFRFPAGTSRGILQEKDTWYLILSENTSFSTFGIGEAAPLKGLSIDDRPDLEDKLKRLCLQLNDFTAGELEPAGLEAIFQLREFPSLLFALETALLDLKNGGQRIVVPSSFSEGASGIPINGLIWMGDKEFMLEQIEKKLKEGYSCLKMKIGAIDFNAELALIEHIRKNFSPDKITLRLDANGAYSFEEAKEKLQVLSDFHIHSIEQPIKQGQIEQMSELCAVSPIPVALDEELIGISGAEGKEELLDKIKPPYIILKPTLTGGLHSSMEWLGIAEKYNSGWWLTSALESNIGLNAIAQFAASLNIGNFPQGLGTGQLYVNNIDCPLVISSGSLIYKPQLSWNLKGLFDSVE